MRRIAWIVLAACGAAAVGCRSGGPKISPEEAIAHYVASQQLKNDDQALAELNKAVQADPTCSVAYTSIGDIHRRRGNHELARRAYEAACAANPYFFRPHYNLGVTYQVLAEAAKTAEACDDFLRKACDIYLRAITIQADDYDANLNLSACYFQLGKYNQAEQYCLAATKADPKRCEAYTNLAIIYDSQNRLYEAIKWYRMSLEVDTHQPKMWLNLGSTFLRQDRLDYALSAFKTAAKEDPKSPAPHEQMGSTYYRIAMDHEAAAQAAQAKSDRKSADQEHALATEAMKNAMDQYEQALKFNAKSDAAYRGMGVIYVTQFLADQSKIDLRDKGLTAWNASLEINPNQDDLKKLVEKYTPKAATRPSL